MTEPLCKNKFYDHICQVILLSLYFNKHVKLQELRNTVDGILRLQSKTAPGGTTGNTIESSYYGTTPGYVIIESIRVAVLLSLF
jgi:hypothetical protein